MADEKWILDDLHRLAHPNFGPDNLSDEINDQDVHDAFWNNFQNASECHGQIESTWSGLRAALRVIVEKRATGKPRK